jgi:hypothetical protein
MYQELDVVNDHYDEFKEISRPIWTGQKIPQWVISDFHPNHAIITSVDHVVSCHIVFVGARQNLHRNKCTTVIRSVSFAVNDLLGDVALLFAL